MTKNEILEEALRLSAEKKDANKAMRSAISEYSEANGIDKSVVSRCKDYAYYRGLGWNGDDPITKSAEKIKYADRVSPVFRKLLQIVNDMRDTGTIEDLEVYTTALEQYGIHILIDETDAVVQDVDEFRDVIRNCKGWQKVVCENNDEITDVLAEQAEEENFAPKNKFKEIVQLHERANAGKDVGDQVNDKVLWTELYESALQTVEVGGAGDDTDTD
jgi:hypothetical protein